MELIPILSLIILVATISTFILSVGAYILYKVRERKGMGAQAPLPSAIPAELVTPSPITASQVQGEKVATGRKTFEVLQSPQTDFGYKYQRPTNYKTEETQGPELRPTFAGSTQGEGQYTDTGEKQKERKKYTEKKKFMRYTSEGYVEPSKHDKRQEDNLQWR